MNIEIRITPRRRCGFRRAGGLYLVAGNLAAPCGKLPLELSKCPCCGAGIKPSRGFTWVNATALFAGKACVCDSCDRCPVRDGLGRAGLLWVGGCYYPSPASFIEETLALGVSRRIPALPHEFKLGATWILLAHRKALTVFSVEHPGGVEQHAAIFQAFRPAAVEYVVTGKETDAVLEKLVARGITPVRDLPPETKELELNDETRSAKTANRPE